MTKHTNQPIAVLVHGLWMDGTEMKILGKRLTNMGYQTLMFSYPTIQASVTDNAQSLWNFLESHFGSNMLQAPPGQVHLVCHSLGGSVALEMLYQFPQANIGRMVALGTPFRGSRAAQRIADFKMGRFALGKSLNRAMGGGGYTQVPPGREIGILAGDLAIGFGPLIFGVKKPCDGTVSVSETYLEGAKAHQTLPVIHMGLVFSRRAVRMVHHFLSWGTFG